MKFSVLLSILIRFSINILDSILTFILSKFVCVFKFFLVNSLSGYTIFINRSTIIAFSNIPVTVSSS